MTIRPFWLFFSVAAIFSGGSSAFPAEATALSAALESIKTDELKQHVQVLADDSFEGREAGSRGGRAVGVYLSDQFKKCKLHPAGASKGYFQPFGTGYRNILGLVPGSDAKLAAEVVVVSAHYDHVGYGTAQNSLGPIGYIHNGADDNASGVAGLLEVAEAISLLPQSPRRTILFALWDGEEKGLLGSQYWLSKPTAPVDRVAAMINLDMIGRLRDNRVEVYGSRTAAGFRALVSRANQKTALRLDFSWELKENSDHYPFYARSRPVLMFHTGLHDDYHRPSDDVDTLNPQGIQRVSSLVLQTALALANADTAPSFRPESKQETVETSRLLTTQVLSQPAARLGLRWDANAVGPGIKVSHVSPGSAAARAGISAGDQLLRFAGHDVADGEEFRSLVMRAKSPAQAVVRPRGQANTKTVAVPLSGKPVRVGISWRLDAAEPGTAIVTRIIRGSPAEKAGLLLQDRLYEVAGEHFRTDAELAGLLRQSDGQTQLLVERDGQLQKLSILLQEEL